MSKNTQFSNTSSTNLTASLSASSSPFSVAQPFGSSSGGRPQMTPRKLTDIINEALMLLDDEDFADM